MTGDAATTLLHARLSQEEMRVALALLAVGAVNRPKRMRRRALGELACVPSDRSLVRALDSLEAHGLLVLERGSVGRGKCGTYLLRIPASSVSLVTRLRLKVDTLLARVADVEAERDEWRSLYESLCSDPHANQHGPCPIYTDESERQEARRRTWRQSKRKSRQQPQTVAA